MNERIRQFERESHIDVYGLGLDRVKWETSLEKFAELIVRECCLVLEQTETALDRHKWPSPSECGVYIKEHFGVEE